MNVKGADVFDRYQQALARLEEACAIWGGEGDYNEAERSMLRDSVIQRFEIAIELFWKTLRAMLALPPDSGSRKALQEAYRLGWIDDEKTWLALISERNLTSHEYDEAKAIRLAENVVAFYLPTLLAARDSLKPRVISGS